ncbi:CACTA en-spm transposon protein [Cucumis melo var. makuwa]|uniref:CACTA en-spm transposon protein n=1 Tax=Cucumis melo var. makuwa TaxID=1194695 RepID=A0A5D3D0A5_CUCMM|nr:CACTA en-spm transposon protein [Cucumis melo var. makuwa]
MLNTFKEFQGDCHRHFKKYSDVEEARVNPLNLLVGRDENWHFLCDHYMSRAFQDRSHQALASEVKQVQKLIQDMTWAQQEPKHDP